MWNENFFLIGPFPDHCLLVLFYPKRVICSLLVKDLSFILIYPNIKLGNQFIVSAIKFKKMFFEVYDTDSWRSLSVKHLFPAH